MDIKNNIMITVFTPTYNRATLLLQLYESLCRQSYSDFEWIIVDDGSTDDTRNVVEECIKKQSKFPIQYIYKENGGKHTAINRGVKEANGELFFTDPPYGLKTQDDTDSLKELPFNGVYRIKKNGEVDLVLNSITRPNGLAFFPGTSKLLVACSDPDQPDWHLIDMVSDSMMAVSLFYSAKEERKTMKTGLPDGLKINRQGVVFASGPGGIYIFNKEGKKLGLLKLEAPASNCALSTDEKTLYITNDMQVLRIKLK